MTETTPAAEGLPVAALDSAADGASALDAWARDPHGRNFLAHALVQLARDGWLRSEPGEGFEPVRDRETPEPVSDDLLAAQLAPLEAEARAAALTGAADFLRDAHFREGLGVQEIGTAMRHWADRERADAASQPETEA